MKKILFVCLGNICRSPLGEGIFQSFVDDNGLKNNYLVDSAGTNGCHDGEQADVRMRKTAEKKNILLTSISRQVKADDFDNFDLIIAMDKSNKKNLEELALKNSKKISHIKLMREYDDSPEDFNVPDPYFGGQSGFDDVFEIVNRSCMNLLSVLEKNKS